MRRADRLFQIVQLLRGGRLTTAARLAERLEVSERTIYRDIADLQASGVPVDGAAGVGYVLRDGSDVTLVTWGAQVKETLEAAEKLAAGTSEEAFYTAKLQTARFYFQRILPRTRTHVATMLSGANNLMDMKEEDFGLAY